MMAKILNIFWRMSVTLLILVFLVLIAVVSKFIFDDREWEAEED